MLPKLIGLSSCILSWNKPYKEKVWGNYPVDGVAVKEAGGMPVTLPPTYTTEDVHSFLSRLDGVILTGGGDVDPACYHIPRNDLYKSVNDERDHAEILLVRTAIEMGKPILAICRGIQVLNVALGGTLIADIPTQRAGALAHRNGAEMCSHPVNLVPVSKLSAVVGHVNLQVNSTHHQAVDKLGKGLRITATAPDGIIEGVELKDHPFCVGVQWHPEIKDGNPPEMINLYRAFLQVVA